MTFVKGNLSNKLYNLEPDLNKFVAVNWFGSKSLIFDVVIWNNVVDEWPVNCVLYLIQWNISTQTRDDNRMNILKKHLLNKYRQKDV